MEAVSVMKSIIIERIKQIRLAMKNEGIDIYIVPSSDPHLSEYFAERFKSRAFLSGFTGSAGTLVVTKDAAGLFTDGRYFIQAEKQLEGTGIDLYRMKEPGVPTLDQWLDSRLHKGMVLGYDGRLFSYNQLKEMKETLKRHEIGFIEDRDLVNMVWKDRPGLPNTKVFVHDRKYTGADVGEKVSMLRENMKLKKIDSYLMNALGDIAWLFNIRSRDVKYTPVSYAYALIDEEGAKLYIDRNKLDMNTTIYLQEEGVDIRDYHEYYDDLKSIENKRIFFDPDMANGLMTGSLCSSNTLIEGTDLVFMMKGCLNETEEKSLKKCQIRDGVAMVNFLHWLDSTSGSRKLTEIEASRKLEGFRAEQERFIEPSFETISAYGENAALMHYSIDESNPVEIGDRGLYLVDSGGQYYDGTTDITRTVALGELTDEERRDFTLVLKAHISLAKVVFLEGCTGTNLDIIARQPIWAEYMDYKCGTGHGVAYVGSVHEGPAGIRKEIVKTVLKPGMIVTNEPGIYKENKHGIRIENTLFVRERVKNDMGTFLDFETISYCPIDTRCIDISMLTQEETDWLNAYHCDVYEKLSQFLEEEPRIWLKESVGRI